MTISNEAFAALVAAVGERHVSRDAAMVFGNSWNSALGTDATQGKLLDPENLPVAVVLPSTVEEVAAVVKACKRYALNFRALSTGWGNMAGVSRPNSVSIDLRRMNRCEIDVQNNMAVIEPYVTAGQLMAEAMKHGLTTHVVGAGPTHSPLASATSFWGIGISGATTGHNARNMLSLEWVTPEGEIVRLGSAGSDLGWFTGDGPGPSFRGMIRGLIGTGGGIGVFTRIGYRLHPWHGPKQLEYTGRHPQIGIKVEEGTRMRYYQAVWPSWEGVQQAAFEFNAAGVTTVQLRMPPEHIAWTLSATNNEYFQQVNTDNLPAVARQENGCSWSILTTAYSDAHDVYNDKVVRLIVERTGGRMLDIAQDHAQVLARNLATSCYVPRVLRPANAATTSFGVFESLHVLPRTIEATKALYADGDLAKKYLHTVGEEQNWTWPTERRSIWSENILGFKPGEGKEGELERAGAFVEALLYQDYLVESRRCGVETFLIGPGVDISGPSWGPNANLYTRKIKNTFDPQNRSDPFIYPADPMPIAGAFGIAKKFLFRPAFRPLLRKLSQGMARKK